MDTIVLIGTRAAAREAVETLGYHAVTIEAARRPEQADHAFGGKLEEALTSALHQLGGKRLVAVIGVAEGSVPLAAALRKQLGLRGLSTHAAHWAHDKLAMKQAVSGAGIPCAPWVEVTESTTAAALVDQLGFPVVLKVPVSSGGRGVRIYHDFKPLEAALVPGLLAEGFVNGTEMSVESFMLEDQTLLRNQTRYLKVGLASILPARLAITEENEVNALAERVHAALELGEGLTHMELFLTENGPLFGEIAARPPGGRLMNLLAHVYHFNPWEAVIRIALGEDPGISVSPDGFAGAHLLYPEPGQIQTIEGIREASRLPGILEVKCHANVGEWIKPRRGTGQMKGHILSHGATMAHCEAQLLAAFDRIRFHMHPSSPHS